MTKKELTKLVLDLQNQFKGAVSQVAQSNAAQEWQTAQIQALEASLKGLSTLPNLLKDSKSEEIQLKKLQKYQLPNPFATEYWFRINKWGDWWANSCDIDLGSINSEDPVKQREYLLIALKYAKLFNSACLYKDKDGFWHPAVWTNYDMETGKIEYSTNITSTAITVKDQSLLFDGEVHKGQVGEDVIVLMNNDLNIGDYVLLIPWIGKEIFFEWQMHKNLSWINIVPSTPNANENQRGQSAPFLSSATNWYADETIDRQVGVNVESIKGAKLKWIVPPVEIKETYEVLERNLKELRECFYQRYGRPFIQAFDKQHLNSDVSNQTNHIEYTAKDFYRCYENMMLELIKVGLINLSLEEVEEEVDNKFQTEEPKENKPHENDGKTEQDIDKIHESKESKGE